MSPVARKRFGQHFLHDPRVIARIIGLIAPHVDDTIVEIGPGRGALTRPLLAAVARLHVIEIDRDLAGALPALCRGAGDLVVHQADVLDFDFRPLATAGPVRLVGNLPYNISTPLLFHVLEQAGHIKDLVFMLQKEVADRLVATPGTKTYGRLSVMVQWCAAVETLLHIGPGAFTPPPQVDSTVVRLVPYAAPPHPVRDPKHFARIVKGAFGQRRKTLRNALKGIVAPETLIANDIDPTRRGETLSIAEFARLANAGP